MTESAIFLLGIIVAIAVIGLGILFKMWLAWWLYPAWGWFLIPLGIPEISYWHLVGLLFCISILKDTRVDKEKDINWISTIASMILAPPIAYLILKWISGN